MTDIYEMGEEELQHYRGSVMYDELSSATDKIEELQKIRAELLYKRDIEGGMTTGLAHEEGTYDYVARIMEVGRCPKCGRAGEFNEAKIDWPDMDREAYVDCPAHGKSYVYRTKRGEWS